MKTVFLLLFLLVVCEISIAQSKENFRSRNYKLNRNYLKDINSRNHGIAFYSTVDRKVADGKLKRSHRAMKSPDSKTAAMKADRRIEREIKKNELRNQKSTLRGANKKSGKQLLSYFSMILAFSLILVNK